MKSIFCIMPGTTESKQFWCIFSPTWDFYWGEARTFRLMFPWQSILITPVFLFPTTTKTLIPFFCHNNLSPLWHRKYCQCHWISPVHCPGLRRKLSPNCLLIPIIILRLSMTQLPITCLFLWDKLVHSFNWRFNNRPKYKFFNFFSSFLG